MKFSKLLFASMLFLLSFQVVGQVDPVSIDSTFTEVTPNIEDVVNEVLQVITNDSTGMIELPGTFDPTNKDSLFEWWMFLYALIMPIGLWFFHRFWPSSTKSELILKSTSLAIIVLLIVVFMKGASLAVIGQAATAFIMKVVAYKNFLKPLAKSPRLNQYDSSK